MSLRTRIHREDGIGLVELLIAMTILAVAIAALLAVFAGSILTLGHAGKESTAVTIADRQLEVYRSLPAGCIPVPPLTQPSSTNCPTPPPTGSFPDPYAASQTVSGSLAPDHHSYSVSTAASTVSLAAGATSTMITVTVTAGSETLANETSYFSAASTTTS